MTFTEKLRELQRLASNKPIEEFDILSVEEFDEGAALFTGIGHYGYPEASVILAGSAFDEVTKSSDEMIDFMTIELAEALVSSQRIHGRTVVIST